MTHPVVRLDALTGLPTFHAVADRLAAGAAPFGVFFDIDGLVRASDAFGHAYTDQVLVRVGRCLDAAAKAAGGETFRTGGDEFLVVLPNASHDEALAFARSGMRAVADLQLRYSQSDSALRRYVLMNAAVCRVTAQLTERSQAQRDWLLDAIGQAKRADNYRIGVVADAGEELPEWALS